MRANQAIVRALAPIPTLTRPALTITSVMSFQLLVVKVGRCHRGIIKITFVGYISVAAVGLKTA